MSSKKLNQVKLLEETVSNLKKDSNILTLIVRGSIAKNLEDEYSDIDLLIVVSDSSYSHFLHNINTILAKQVELLTPQGWIDTNVPNFGGIGFVYLANYESKPIQLDIYILPEENAKTIMLFKDRKTLYSKRHLNYKKEIDLSDNIYSNIASELTKSNKKDLQLFLDVLLHFFMLTKHVYRKDTFLSYKYWYLTNSKLLFYIRSIFENETKHFGFYDVHRHLDKYDFKNIANLERQLSSSFGVFNYDGFLELYDIFISVVEEYQKKLYINNLRVIKKVEKHFEEINIQIKKGNI